MQQFKQLKVWQRSHALALKVYELTSDFPRHEQFGLVAQLRRAITSDPTNVAEGAKRRGSLDYARMLNIAEASLSEASYLLMLSRDLGYLGSAKSEPLLAEAEEISRMLCSLRDKVERGAPR